MTKHANQPLLAFLKVALLGVSFPLLLTSHNWVQANTKQDNILIYAQTPAKSTPQASQPAEVKKTTPTQQEKQEKGEKSDDDKKSDLPLTVVLAILGGVGVLYVGVLCFSPLWLLRLPAELKVPKLGMIPEFKLPLGFVIWLKYRPRVLDAWVEKHIDTFDKKFQENETVDERKDYVSLPVELNKQEIEELTTEDLRQTFEKEKRVRLLIWGEGGSGKTTIACQIAKWAMIKDKSKRLTQHLMLPVLIEQELKSQSGEGMKPLMEDIVGQIQDLSDGEQKIVDELLVEQLLRQRRILLIVDHFSEMSQQTREKINPEVPEFPANALVITSRIEEKFIDVDYSDRGGVLFYAAQALVNLGNTSPPVVQTLLGILTHSPYAVWLDVAKILINLDNTSKPALDGLLALLEEENSRVCLNAAKVLLDSGNPSEPVLQTLSALLEDEDSWVRLDAAKVLLDSGNPSEPVLQTLSALLEEEDSEVSDEAARVLEELRNFSKDIQR